MLEGISVNLRVFEREDLPLVAVWGNNPAFGGEFEPLEQVSLKEVATFLLERSGFSSRKKMEQKSARSCILVKDFTNQLDTESFQRNVERGIALKLSKFWWISYFFQHVSCASNRRPIQKMWVPRRFWRRQDSLKKEYYARLCMRRENGLMVLCTVF
jgi:hypothetical protein